MKSLIALVGCLALLGVMAVTHSYAAKSIGGTIEVVDPAAMTVTITTESGQKTSLPVADPSILAGLTQGERVFCEMNEEGTVTKIVKASPIMPAPEPKG